MVSFLDRASSLARGLRRKPAAKRRRDEDRRLRLAIDQLESRVALAITTPLSIGGTTVGSFTDAPTGPGNIGDYVTVSIEGTRGTVTFVDSNGNPGVADGTDIRSIQITDASPDFQVTFNGVVRTSGTGTPAPIPYGSDGIIQLGQISTSNVIRGINTVRGPLTNTAPTTGVPSPVGFTQTAGGSTLTLAGDWTGSFPANTFVCATPEVVSSGSLGSPVFARVSGTPTFSGGFTTIVLDESLPSNTTGGALTLAESVNPSFELTSFVGVNFSNRGLKDSGGIFVDRVVGGTTEYGDNTGIALSQGLLAYSSIMIRDELDAAIILGATPTGPTPGAAVDGRVFIESATSESTIFVGRQSRKTAKNSRFELQGGEGEFGALVQFSTPFNQGVVNLGGPATGTFQFLRGVGPQAVLNASNWADVEVDGTFAGMINATEGAGGSVFLYVEGDLAATARVSAAEDITLRARNVLKGATVAAGDDTSLGITGNFAGALTTGGTLVGNIDGNVTGATIVASEDMSLDIGGNVVNSAISTDNELTLDVGGSIRNSRFFAASGDMSIDVAGNVAKSSFNVGYEYDLELVVGGTMTGSNAQTGSGDVTVDVAGNVTSSLFTSTSSDVTIDVGGDFLKNKIVTGDDVSLTVGRDALDNTVLADDNVTLDIGRNWRGVAQSASSDIRLDVGGSVLKRSSFTSGEDTLVNVAGNFDANTTSRALRFFVGGNVSKASRIVAQQVVDWDLQGGQNFRIGGRLDGVVNVVDFDGAPNEDTVTLIEGGAGKSARFYVGRFQTDTLVFNGNFRGNLRVLQDLVANLTFQGNVDRITVGGRVGTYNPGNTVTTTFVNILVTGRLLFMNTNSYFQADVPGVSGTFWNTPVNVTTVANASTGQIVTGSYGQIVPTRPTTVAPPVGGDTQSYTVPDAPTSVTATVVNDDEIQITFAAPANDTLPILRTVYYQWSSDGTTWNNFTDVLQQPGTVTLPGTFSPGFYTIRVRAINAIGPSTAATSNEVEVGTP